MKIQYLGIIVISIGICYIVTVHAYGCVYCPAEQSMIPVQPQQEIPSIVWEIIVVIGVISCWVVIFRLFKEKDIVK